MVRGFGGCRRYIGEGARNEDAIVVTGWVCCDDLRMDLFWVGVGLAIVGGHREVVAMVLI